MELQNEELRRAQDELNESRDAFADLYDFAPLGYVTIDENGIILKANITFAELLGRQRRLVVKQRISAFIIEEDQDAFYTFQRRVIESGEKQSCELRLHNEQVPFWARLYGAVVQRNTDGAIQLRLAVADIGKQKKMDALLHDSKARSQALLDHSPVCHKIIDLESRLQYMSPAGLEQLKIADTELLYGKNYPPEFYPEAMRAPLHEHLERAQAGEVSSVESPAVDMEGNELW
jgi:PAS domain S-box-containing protein